MVTDFFNQFQCNPYYQFFVGNQMEYIMLGFLVVDMAIRCHICTTGGDFAFSVSNVVFSECHVSLLGMTYKSGILGFFSWKKKIEEEGLLNGNLACLKWFEDHPIGITLVPLISERRRIQYIIRSSSKEINSSKEGGSSSW